MKDFDGAVGDGDRGRGILLVTYYMLLEIGQKNRHREWRTGIA